MRKSSFLINLLFAFSLLNANASRSMYVDGFENILGDDTAENALLDYAQSHGIETLLLYGLHIVNANHDLANPTTNQILADFIDKAKTNYTIISVGATAENADFFTNVIDAYNNSRSNSSEKFDIYNLEFEYWINAATGSGGYYCTTYLTPNGLPCTEEGAFQFYISILQTMKTLADNNVHPITTEAYVGWTTTSQAVTIGANLDKLRLHAYVSDPNTAFNYSDDRLIDFANGTPDLDVSIIFSSESAFMKNWLENNSMLAAENVYTTDWSNGSSGWSNNINLEGFTYFTYSEMANVSLPVEFSYFRSQSKDNGVQLTWKTLSETNADYFELQRQTIKTHQFNSLGQIKSKGNSTSASSYQFLDPNPNSGTNYYRLKQVDHDGRFAYSNTIAIDYQERNEPTKVYPLLATDHLFIESNKVIDRVFIYHTNGQIIKEVDKVNLSNTQIDINDLKSGVYLLILKYQSALESFRFIKQN